jgi:hypothetical protein
MKFRLASPVPRRCGAVNRMRCHHEDHEEPEEKPRSDRERRSRQISGNAEFRFQLPFLAFVTFVVAYAWIWVLASPLDSLLAALPRLRNLSAPISLC